MNFKNAKRRRLAALSLLASASLAPAQTFVYNEEFDGNGNGYNPDSATALVGDADWVDTGNRIIENFAGNEGYFTAVGGTESVLTGRSNSGDPQLRTDFAIGVPKADVGRIELRLRIDLDQDDDFDSDDALIPSVISFFWGTNTYVEPGAGNGNTGVSISLGNADSVTAQADGWHLFVWDDNGGLSGGSGPDLNSFRLDPVDGGANIGASFEIDYLRIEESTLIDIDPVTPVGSEFTLREEWTWDTDGDQEGWTVGSNGHLNLAGVAGGLFTGTSTAGDAQFFSPTFQVLDVESGRFIIEVGLVVDINDTSFKQLFWGLNDGPVLGGQSIAFPALPNDGLPHVVRLTFDDLINGRITSLRYDPSNATGVTSNLDFIRIYSEGPEIPYIPPPDPPITELDPAAPLGAAFVLQEQWTFETVDDDEGWTSGDLAIDNPNNGVNGVFEGGIFGTSTGSDARLFSPVFSLNPSESGIFVVEVDYPEDFTPDSAGQFFWQNANGSFLGNSVDTPNVPNLGSSHTVRITLNSDHIPDQLTRIRFDPTNQNNAYFGISEVRVYTEGPSVANNPLEITAFSYDAATGAAEVSLSGNPATVYRLVNSPSLDFANSSAITLTGATVGTLSGVDVQTDGTGLATVQFNLGTSPANFVRAEQ